MLQQSRKHHRSWLAVYAQVKRNSIWIHHGVDRALVPYQTKPN